MNRDLNEGVEITLVSSEYCTRLPMNEGGTTITTVHTSSARLRQRIAPGIHCDTSEKLKVFENCSDRLAVYLQPFCLPGVPRNGYSSCEQGGGG